MGAFQIDELASGSNLAWLETPMIEPSRRALLATERKNEIDTLLLGPIQQREFGVQFS